MTTPSGPSSMERQALAAIRQLRARVQELERAAECPIAIVGLGCRLPGAGSPDQFWRLLEEGRDAVRPYPPDRWGPGHGLPPARPGDRPIPSSAGLLDDVDRFDAEFFGIPPREARLIDPQHRLFLEVAWEALEHAAIPASGLRGTRSGVFVGSTTADYLSLVYRHVPLAELDAYVASGNTLNGIAGRVAFTLGLQGPAIGIDTACSSSLVAIDRACRSLKDGESDIALAGGVNLILGPEIITCLARWGALAADGRCKTFDSAADGYGRAEGAVVFVLKRLADAERDGDTVRAVIRGWAVNQDGPSSGFSVPNGLAQRAVIRDALRTAGLAPAQVGYVEAHGTGTPLGDPIEIEALAETYGADRPAATPLLVGSVKTNIGHCEAAAGAAGLLKVVLALGHRTIPPHIHLQTPSAQIPWTTLPIRIPTAALPWESIDGRRVAGISSFGFSGTNAHMIVEEAPPAPTPAAPRSGPALVTVSGRSPDAVAALASHYADLLEEGGAGPTELGLAAAAGRTHLACRAAAVATDRDGMVASLRAIGADPARLVATIKPGSREKVAFLFTGQGSQYPGMARALRAASPVFRTALAEAVAALNPWLDQPLDDILDATDGRLDHTAFTQPALFALQYALTAWWASVGIRPAVVLGHSIGEFAAATAAGVIDLAVAARLVAARGRLMGDLPAGGAMAAVEAPAATVEPFLGETGGAVVIAGYNAPDETVISGDGPALDAVVLNLDRAGLKTRRLTVSHAFHSPLMASIAPALRATVEGLVPQAARCTVVSSVTGAVADARFGTAAYWAEQVVAPVRFADAARTLDALGATVAIEIGPHPVLAALAARTVSRPIGWLPSLRRNQDGEQVALTALGECYRRGVVDDWSGADGQAWRSRVPLPTYAFQRTRHWVADRPAVRQPERAPAGHPLLGDRIPAAVDSLLFGRTLAVGDEPILDQHRFRHAPLVPAAALLDLMLAAAARDRGATPTTIRDVTFRIPLRPSTPPTTVQTVMDRRTDGGAELQVKTQGGAEGAWVLHATGAISPASPALPPLPFVPATPGDDATPLGVEVWYRHLADRSADFGACFRSLESVWTTAPGAAWGRIRLTPDAAADAGRWHLPPTLVDGALQLVSLAQGMGDEILLPAGVERFHWFGTTSAVMIAQATTTREPSGRVVADIRLAAPDGTPIAALERAWFLPAREPVAASPGDTGHTLETRWVPVAPSAEASVPAPAWQVAGPNADLGQAVAAALRASSRPAEWTPRMPPAARNGAVIWIAAPGAPAAVTDGLRDLQTAVTQGNGPVHLVTIGAQAVRPGEHPDPESAGLWGLWRSAALEHPETVGRRIDLDPDGQDHAAAVIRLVTEWPAGETELAWRDGDAVGARLMPVREVTGDVAAVASEPGRLESLGFAPVGEAPLRPDQVAIAVEGAGLNFRDVLVALGMFPAGHATLGGECAGTVLAVGSAVTDLAPGDPVMAMAPGSLGTRAVVARHLMVRRPEGLPPAIAAGLPIAYLTALLGIEHLAEARAGERILVHAGAGGVGWAAIQVARQLGMRVFATAGTPAKRARLAELGLDGVYDSRSASFRDAVLAATGGEGVDVVLNSLSGALIEPSLALLRPGGRFLELGKRGIWTHDRVRQGFPGVTYLPFDLGDSVQADPGLAPRLFARLMDGLASGQLPPIPVTAFPMSRLADGFRLMAQGRHFGKVVFHQDLASRPVRIRPDASYLITGGTGGIGLAVATSLVARGARTLVLVGRTADHHETDAAVAAMRAAGAHIELVAADLGDRAEAAERIRPVLDRLPALRGVIHAAGALDDRPLLSLNPDSVAATRRPKLDAARVLDGLTESAALDFLVAFGAGAAVLGSAGQASYAAANESLEAWARGRSAAGFPTTFIAWGRWSEIGMAARMDAAGQQRFDNAGHRAMAPAEGIEALFAALGRAGAAVAVLPMDWERYLRSTGATDARFSNLAAHGPAADVGAEPDLDTAIRRLPMGERRSALRAAVTTLARRVLGMPPERPLDPEAALRDLGMDSLMTVELRNVLGRAIGQVLPTTVAFDYPTINALVSFLGRDLLPAEAAPAPSAETAGVAALSEEEAEAELLREIESGRP